MKKRITIIEESGAAAEVTEQAVKILSAVGEQYEHHFEIESIAPDGAGHFTPDAKSTIAQSDAVLFSGAATAKTIEEDFRVFAMAQPVTVYHSLHHLSPLKNKYSEGLNLLMYQEPVAAADEKSRRRIVQSAFEQAAARKQKVTFIEHANWQTVAAEFEKTYKDIRVEQIPAAQAISQLLNNPAAFDIIITGTDAGYYLFRQAAALAGTPAMIPSVWAAEATSFFGPAFGCSTDEAGKSQVNPIGSILSVAMMLNYFNMPEEALIVRTAVNWTLLHGFVAKDIDPVNNYSTSTIGELISDFVRGSIPGFAKGENMALQKSTII
ncbi:MAG: 3-isopropylmalate dehydrogenase [Niabella sp.]|nr:3-isopropylmalate dehydrogenase [Niabella sp.]